jgi:zinc transporter ZupT
VFLQEENSGAIAVLIAIIAHKVVEALTVGTGFAREGISFRKAVPVVVT